MYKVLCWLMSAFSLHKAPSSHFKIKEWHLNMVSLWIRGTCPQNLHWHAAWFVKMLKTACIPWNIAKTDTRQCHYWVTLQSCWWSASRSPAQPQTPALMEQPPELWIVSSGATHHNHHPYINTEYLHWYYWWEQLFPSLHCFVNSVSHFLTFSGHLLLRRGLFKELFFC